MAADDAGPTAILFAAMHPEKVSSLVLVNTSARYLVGDDYPIGASPEQVDALVAIMAARGLHVTGNPFVRVTHGRYIADHIAGADFIELPGGDVGFTPEA
jgi:pimeloyl-ACP methyl ester carboxylesterase